MLRFPRFRPPSIPRGIQLAHTSTHISSLAPPPPRAQSLSGTVPHHTSYLFLHTLQPPGKWPSIFLSRLYFEVQKKVKEYNGLVNFSWEPGRSHDDNAALNESSHEEAYGATFWKMPRQGGPAHRIEIPLITTSNLEEVLSNIFLDNLELDDSVVSEPYFYVCTHGERDCRCGIRGGEFAESLRGELKARGVLFDQSGSSRVAEVGHVGGHKNAPNVIVFPHGDWYGNLRPSDIPPLLDHWFKPVERSAKATFIDGPNPLQWRGRMGLTKEQQVLVEVPSRIE